MVKNLQKYEKEMRALRNKIEENEEKQEENIQQICIRMDLLVNKSKRQYKILERIKIRSDKKKRGSSRTRKIRAK